MKTILLSTFLVLCSLISSGQTKIEAEDGTVTDATVSTAVTGFSGTGYVVFQATGNISISVDRETAGLYFLTLGYRAEYGEKTQDLYVNGAMIQGIIFPESATFTTLDVGQINLDAGTNTIEIRASWGYMDIDYFSIDNEISPSPIADAGPEQVKMDIDGDGLATFTLDASATTDPNDDIVSYLWSSGTTVIGNGIQVQYEGNMGQNDITLLVTDAEGNTDTDQLKVFVGDPTNNGNNRISAVNTDQLIFANGINLAWDDFARDIVTLDAAYFEDVLNSIQAAGGNAMRWWLHTNGSQSPIFDAQGNVTGLNPNTIANMKTVLDMAYERGIKISMCLWSFDMLQPQGQDQEMMKNFVESKEKTQTYIDNALIPILEQIGNHPAVLSWEIFNEAEGMTQEFGWTPVKTQMLYVQQFVNLTAAAIHRTVPKALVSTGSWSFRALTDIEGNTNYYRDDRLIAAGGDPDGILDFYQVHYYPENFGNNLSPFHRPADWWQLDKPILIGEFPTKAIDATADPHYTTTQAYQLAIEYGYAGAMAWDYRGFDGGSFETAKEGIQYLADNYPNAINLGIESYVYKNGKPQLTLFPNPLTDNHFNLRVLDNGPITVELIDIFGKKLGQYSLKGQLQYTLNTENLASGITLVKVSSDKFVTTQKLIKK
ncbi:MAG: CBM35 domain-containing protein [Leeuwenhoekiella sp.]